MSKDLMITLTQTEYDRLFNLGQEYEQLKEENERLSTESRTRYKQILELDNKIEQLTKDKQECVEMLERVVSDYDNLCEECIAEEDFNNLNYNYRSIEEAEQLIQRIKEG